MKRTSIKKDIFACIATLLIAVSSFAQTITGVTATPAAVCAGGSVSVDFVPTAIPASTVFTVQLSDAAGAFGSPVALGTGTANPISVTIPTATVAGTGYKVRVITVTPAVTGSESALTINAISAAPTVTNKNYTVGEIADLSSAATGTGLLWYAAATGGTGSATTPTPTTATAGTTSYYVSQTVAGSCESPRAKIDVIVTACTPPSTPGVANVTYTVGDPASPLTATGLASGAVYKWYESASGGTPLAGAPTPSTSTVGTKSYFVSQAIGSCESARAQLVVTVNPCTQLPSAPTVAPANYVVGAPASALTAIGVSGATLKWYDSAPSTTPLASAPVPSTATAGTRSYFVTQTVGFCESPKAEIVVTVSAVCVPPAAPTVVNKSYNVGDTPVSLALSVTGTNLLWYNAASGGTGSATAPVIVTNTAGTTSYWVTQSASPGSCESPRSKIDVIVSAVVCVPPAAPAVVNKNYTVGDSPVSLALSVTGTNLLWYNVASGGTASATAPVIVTNTAGTTSYWVTQSASPGSCESPRSKIDVIVSAVVCVPPAAPAVVNKNYTVGDSPVSLALSVTGTNLLWYTAASGGTGSSTPPAISTASAGTTSYWVTQSASVGSCESLRSKIDVIVSAVVCVPPAAPVVVNKNYTVGDSPVSLALSVTGTNLLWYTAASGGTGSSIPPAISTASAGTTSYWVTQSASPGSCESPRSKIDVIVSAVVCVPPAAPAVVNKNYTVGDSPVSLALSVTGTNLLWYTAASGGTGSSTPPAISTASAGTTSYWVTQSASVGSCESLRSKIDVIVSACTPPAAPTVSNVSYTVNATNAVALTATGIVSGATVKWYDTATGTTALASAPVPSTATIGAKSYFVSQTLNNCESPRATIVVTITACVPPAAPTVVNVNYIVNATNAVALTATGIVSGAIVKWYDTAASTTALASAPVPSTATVGSRSYFVTQTINACESARAEIVVTITACVPPAAPTVANVSYTVNASAAALTATGIVSGAIVKWYDTATSNTALASAPVPSTATVGSRSYFVTQTVNACESARAEIVVTITACVPPAAPTVSNVSYTVNATNAVALTATGIVSGATVKWYDTAASTTALASAPVPSTATVGSRSYFVTQTVNACESARAEIVVTITACVPPVAPTVALATVTYCAGTVSVALTATGTALKWYTVETGGVASTTAPLPSTSTVGTTSYYVSQTIGCESARTKVDVVIRALPALPVVTPVEYCKDIPNTVALTATGTGLKWYNTATNGTALATAPVPSTSTVGTVSYYVSQTTTSDGLSCESPRAALNVTVNPTPAALTATPVEFCQELTAKTYAFPVQPASGNTVNWYAALTGGTPSTTTPSVNLATAGTTTYYATQITAKGCESVTRTVQSVRVKPLPALPTIPAAVVEICQFVKAAPLTATPVATGILNWYGTDATGGTASLTAPVPATAVGGTTSYYVAQTLEGCLGERAKIDVKINTTPKPVTTTYLAYCQGVEPPILSATGTILKWYRTAADTAWQGFPFTPFAGKVEDYSFFVTQTGTANGCESPKEEIKIHIKALPSATITGTSTIALGQTASITLKFTGDGPWKYILSNGVTDSTDQATKVISVTPAVTTTYIVTEVSNSCGKGAPIGSALVTVQVPTISSGNPSVAEVCAGKSFAVPFQQSGTFPVDNKFNVQISLVNEDSKFYTIPSVATANLVTATFPDTIRGGNYFVRVVSAGVNPSLMVKGSVSAIGLTANALPIATISGSQTILAGAGADIKVDFTGRSPWTFTLNNGVKDSLINIIATPYILNVKPKTTTTYTVTSVTNGCGAGKGAGSARIQVDPILAVEPPVTEWLNVYPTVVDGQCTVEITGSISSKEANVQVIDMNGRPVFNQIIRQKTTGLDFSQYPSGLYLLQVQNGNLNSVRKIVKP